MSAGAVSSADIVNRPVWRSHPGDYTPPRLPNSFAASEMKSPRSRHVGILAPLVAPFAGTGDAATLCMHRLLAPHAEELGDRPADLWRRGGKERARAEEFGEQCLLSLAIWRRFGSGALAEAMGWVPRTDYAAVVALLDRVVEAAVDVWRSGRHAAAEGTAAQRSVRAVEAQAWAAGHGSGSDHRMGGVLDGGGDRRENNAQEASDAENARTLSTSAREAVFTESRLQSFRATRATPAGEARVRAAYTKLLRSPRQPIWDLWEKRQSVVEVLLGGHGFAGVREALRQVRGFCGPDPEGERAGWELAFDIKTMTLLSDDPGPVAWSGDYITWLRKREVERHKKSAVASARSPAATVRHRPLSFTASDWVCKS